MHHQLPSPFLLIQTSYVFDILHACYILPQSHIPLFRDLNNIFLKEQNKTLKYRTLFVQHSLLYGPIFIKMLQHITFIIILDQNEATDLFTNLT
jgi:hypothetical protein